MQALKAFRGPYYARFYVGLVATTCGFWLRIGAVPWLVYESTGNKDALGQIAAAGLLPWIVFSPWAGVWVDRVDPRRLLRALYTFIFVANLAMAAALLWYRVPFSWLLVWTVTIGIARGIEIPARQTYVRALVGIADLSSAIGMNAVGFHVTQALGLALAGLFYWLGGPALCLGVVALLTLPMLLALARLRHVPPILRTTTPLSPLRALREGFAYAGREPVTRAVVCAAFGTILFLLCWRTVMPAVAKDTLGLGDLGYGLLMSMAGIGSLLAALWVAGSAGSVASRGRRMKWLTALAGGAVATLALSPTRWGTGLGVLVAGFCQVGFMAHANTIVQQAVPDDLRGRVMGIWTLMFGAAHSLGAWAIGVVAESFGTKVALIAFAACGELVLLVVVVGTWRRRQRVEGRSVSSAIGP